ncbi:MAG TPA: hypothetical protein PK379_05820 [Candidatus Hydrogenedentes bacterium]|nr:hypothetical protein [Candidatus Hydrogenedentota bacterium]HOJ68134.1 hypothetical protein [Candidatus Hydrogenedentota bacterium]HOK89524.1 hypothetical protein [Candidatus Hydrogenedentota bacterium]
MTKQFGFWMVSAIALLTFTSMAMAQPAPPAAPAPQGRAAQADTNHDGKLSLDEAKTAFPNMTEERFKALDKNSDGFLTPAERPKPPANGSPAAREQARRQLVARIKRADSDQDGKITLQEAQKEFPRMTPERFNKLDTDGDGALTPNELAQAAARVRKPGPAAPAAPAQHNPRQAARLKKADADGDHRLSREEVKNAFPNMSDEKFKALDKNGDGYLTRNEFPAPPRVPKHPGAQPRKTEPRKNKGNGAA